MFWLGLFPSHDRSDEGNEDKEVWEAFMSYENFKETWGRKYLAEHHCGDCTAVACSCMRCHAEARYKQDTVTWNGKSEGWKLLNQYNDEIKKQSEEFHKNKRKGK